MQSSDEAPPRSGEGSSENGSKTASTTKQSQPEPSKQQLYETLRPRLKKWSELIVEAALAESGQLASRQFKRRLLRAQYKHMVSMAKKLDREGLTLLLEQSGFLEELNEPKLILPSGVKK